MKKYLRMAHIGVLLQSWIKEAPDVYSIYLDQQKTLYLNKKKAERKKELYVYKQSKQKK